MSYEPCWTVQINNQSKTILKYTEYGIEPPCLPIFLSKQTTLVLQKAIEKSTIHLPTCEEEVATSHLCHFIILRFTPNWPLAGNPK